MPCVWGIAPPNCEHQALLTSALVRQSSCCRLAKQHAFKPARKVPRNACRIRAVDESQHKLTTQESTQKQGPLKQRPRPAVVGPGTNLGELQLLPNRRFFLAAAGSLSIILVSNLGGVTGLLLGLDGGQTASKLKIDSIFPVKGLKRCINYKDKFEFQYPGNWLADQNIFARKAQRIERSNSLDPAAPTRPRRSVAEPEAAYGPPGSSGEENISVVVAPIQTGFKLESLGTAEQAGRRFLETTVASINANREANLLAAESRHDATGQLYYNLEYTVKSPDFFRHNISVYAARDGLLYTFNSQCPEDRWLSERVNLSTAANSFRLLQ